MLCHACGRCHYFSKRDLLTSPAICSRLERINLKPRTRYFIWAAKRKTRWLFVNIYCRLWRSLGVPLCHMQIHYAEYKWYCWNACSEITWTKMVPRILLSSRSKYQEFLYPLVRCRLSLSSDCLSRELFTSTNALFVPKAIRRERS